MAEFPHPIEFDAADITRHITVEVTVRVRNTWRITLGCWLFRLGAWVAGTGIEVKDEDR